MSTIRIDFFGVFLEPSGKVSASGWIRVNLAGIVPILHKLRINELMIDHVFDLTLLEFFILEVHHPIPDEQSHQLNLLSLGGRRVKVMMINPECEIRDVFASIRFTSYPKVILRVLGIVSEKVSQCIEIIIHGCQITILKWWVPIDRVANTCGRLDEQKIWYIVPWKWVFGQWVTLRIVLTLLQIKWAYFLKKTYIPTSLPKREEQPGPPFNHNVTGSELLTLLAD